MRRPGRILLFLNVSLIFVICLISGCSFRENPAPVQVSEDFQYVIHAAIPPEDTSRSEGLEEEIPDAAPKGTESEYIEEGSYAYFWIETDAGAEIVKYSGDAAYVIVPAQLLGLPVTSINEYAFNETSVVGIELPNSVTTIHSDAFAGADALETVYISDSTTEIEPNIFDPDSSVSITTVSGSAAEIYATSNNLPIVLR